MKVSSKLIALFTVFLALALSATAVAADEWDLSSFRTIELQGMSGDIVVRPADRGGAYAELESDVRPRDAFEVVVDERGSTLTLKEDWHGSGRGEVKWVFYLAGRQELTIETLSGSLDAKDVSITLDFNTASGDVSLDNVELGRDSRLNTASGDYDIVDMEAPDGTAFNTASGDIRLEHVDAGEAVSFSTASGNVSAKACKGSLSLQSASGDVSLEDSTIDRQGSLSSASGDVFLSLNDVPYDGLSASSASGDVVLDAGSMGGSYTLILVADAERGRIDHPFRVTSERTFEKNRRTYLEQVVERGSGGPEIELRSASGDVVVKD